MSVKILKQFHEFRTYSIYWHYNSLVQESHFFNIKMHTKLRLSYWLETCDIGRNFEILASWWEKTSIGIAESWSGHIAFTKCFNVFENVRKYQPTDRARCRWSVSGSQKLLELFLLSNLQAWPASFLHNTLIVDTTDVAFLKIQYPPPSPVILLQIDWQYPVDIKHN